MFGLGGGQVGTLYVKLIADARQYQATLATAATHTKSITGQMKGHFSSMYGMMGGMAVTGILGASVKAFANFDQAMTESTAIMIGVTGVQKTAMRDLAKTLSKESITSSTELAKAYYYLASAGYDVEQSMKNLPVVEKFAVAGMFDLNKATTLLADSQAALGLKTKDATENQKQLKRISDVLVRGNTLANASVEQLAESLTTKAAAASRLLGKSVEETVAVLAAYADQGMKAADSGEAFSIVTRDLQRAILKQSEAWKKNGLAVYDNQGKMMSYADIIAQLENKFFSLTDMQKRQLSMSLGFQDRSFSALQSLLGTSGKIREFENELKKAGGFADQVANSQLQSFSSQLKITWNNIKSAGGALGEQLAPAIINIGDLAVAATNKFKGWLKSMQDVGAEAAKNDWGWLRTGSAGILNMGGPGSIMKSELANFEDKLATVRQQKAQKELGIVPKKEEFLDLTNDPDAINFANTLKNAFSGTSELSQSIQQQKMWADFVKSTTEQYMELFETVDTVGQQALRKYQEGARVAIDAAEAQIITEEKKWEILKKLQEEYEKTVPNTFQKALDEYNKLKDEMDTSPMMKEFEVDKNVLYDAWQQGIIGVEEYAERVNALWTKASGQTPDWAGWQNMFPQKPMGINEYNNMLNGRMGMGGGGFTGKWIKTRNGENIYTGNQSGQTGINEYMRQLSMGGMMGMGGMGMMGMGGFGMPQIERQKKLDEAGSTESATEVMGLAARAGMQGRPIEGQMLEEQKTATNLLTDIRDLTANQRAMAWG